MPFSFLHRLDSGDSVNFAGFKVSSSFSDYFSDREKQRVSAQKILW